MVALTGRQKPYLSPHDTKKCHHFDLLVEITCHLKNILLLAIDMLTQLFRYCMIFERGYFGHVLANGYVKRTQIYQ